MNLSNGSTRQEQLWKLIKEAKYSRDAVDAIRLYEDVCDLRDEKGCHIVQYVMIHKPFFVNAILSANEKTLALGTTPDEHGRLPSVYWVANGVLQHLISKTRNTAVLIPNQIDEETWRQAAELTYELGLKYKLSHIGLCSGEVQKRFKETTGENFAMWIEKEAANGNPWFERMVELAIKRAGNKNDISGIFFTPSTVVKIWANPDNHRVVNKAHALFRAHLMLNHSVMYFTSNENNLKKQQVEKFFKTHLSGKMFDTFKGQINDGVSFMPSIQHNLLVQSQWWMKTCTTMEREWLLEKFAKTVKTINTPMHKHNL